MTTFNFKINRRGARLTVRMVNGEIIITNPASQRTLARQNGPAVTVWSRLRGALDTAERALEGATA